MVQKKFDGPTLMTKADFARMIGSTRQYVTELTQKGAVATYGNGRYQKINMDAPLTIQFLEYNKYVKDSDGADGIPDPPPEAGMPAGPVEGMDTPLPDVHYDDEADDAIRGIDITKVNKPMLDRLKLLEGIKYQKIKNAEKRGELIPRLAVQRALSRLFVIHSTQLKPLGSNLTPLVAAIYEDDSSERSVRTEEAVTKEIFKTLQHIKREFNKFLRDYGMDELKENKDTGGKKNESK